MQRPNETASFQHCWKLILVIVGMTAAAGGCNGAPFPYDQVSGTIRYTDGEPIPCVRLLVTLVPQGGPIDAKTYPRPAQVIVHPDGTFDLATTINYGDGAIRGRHKVTIVALDENEQPLGTVPPQYASEATTPLEFDTIQTPWEIIVERPSQP